MAAESSDWHGNLRFAARSLWLVAALAVCLPPHGVWRLLGRRSPWPRRFLKVAARACGARVRTVGEPLRRDVFYVANHLSWIDIPVVGGLVETAFVAQDAIAGWPVIGTLARLGDTVFVSRNDRRTASDQVARLRTAIAGPRPMTLFPEGTTTDGHSLLPFKPALFEGIATAPRPLMIQPVLLDFSAEGSALAWIGTETAPANALRTLRRSGHFDVRVHFLAPFDPARFPGRKRICAEVRNRIATALAATTGHPIA